MGDIVKFYLAGKITGSNWRDTLFDVSTERRAPLPLSYEASWGIAPDLLIGGHEYVGPYFIDSGNHAPSWEDGTHGLLDETYEYGSIVGAERDRHGFVEDLHSYVISQCLTAITTADIVFAWIDRKDLYGTLVEIGFARAHRKPVWVGITSSSPVDNASDETDSLEPSVEQDLWFATATASDIAYAETPLQAYEHLLARNYVSMLKQMPYDEYLRTSHWQKKRAEAIDRAHSRCQLCNSDNSLQVHHRTYERRGAELNIDLTVLCQPCHQRFHAVVNGRPTVTVR